ncbi:type I polyketide synthase, partial [Shewanella surugensis]
MMKLNDDTRHNNSLNDPRLNKRLKDSPIAIVGMASLFPHARYLEQFWDLISDKVNAITDVPETHWLAEDYFDVNKKVPDKSYCKKGGFLPEVDFNPMEFGLPPNILELTDTSQLLSLLVAKEVLADARITEGYDRDKIGITLGVGGGQKILHSLTARLQYPLLRKVFKHSGISDSDSEMLIKKFQDQYIHWEENSFPGSLGNVIAGRIANRFNLGGMNCVVDAACAGSLAAMRMAISELVDGRSEMMITGGVCTDNSPSMFMSFSKTPAFTTQEVIQPFDIESKGMMIGEGIGMVVLKRLADAERDGDRIYSVIKGIGSSSDGKFKSIYAPRSEGQAKALRRAYDDAGILPHTLGMVEAHGTGTAAGDLAEFEGLKSVFSEHVDGKQHIALGSVKSQIGHTKSTAGTAGLIKAALALHHKVLPATINVSQPNPKLNIQASPFYLNTETRPWLARVDDIPRRAGISSFGFGGTNFHFVLEEYCSDYKRNDRHSQYRHRSVPETFLFSQPSKAELINVLKETQQLCQQECACFMDIAAAHLLRMLDDDAPRLGLVAKNAAELDHLLTQALTMFNANDAGHWQGIGGMVYRSGALIASADKEKKIAALFAGQGAQYLNMGRELSCHFPEIRAQFLLADKVFNKHAQIPVSEHVYPKPVFELSEVKQQEANLTNTLNAQSAIGALSLGQYQLMLSAGFQADMVAGHSFGELTALYAAGVIKLTDYYQLTYARGEAMAAMPDDEHASVDRGSMRAVVAKAGVTLEQLEICLADFNDVRVANYNSPTQVVIAGPSEAVDKAGKALVDLGFSVINLPVSAAFHTPLVSHAQRPFSEAIDNVDFLSPQCPLYSNSTGQQYSKEANDIKAGFKQHMLQSVCFSQQIIAMYEAGARVFVEFGPKNILQKLVTDILADKSDDLSIISMNPNPKGDSDQQLRLAAVQMAVVGIALNNLDPYQAPKRVLEKLTPMHIKLTATNHISQATQAKMAKSLTTGQVSFGAQKSANSMIDNSVVEHTSNDAKPFAETKQDLISSEVATAESHCDFSAIDKQNVSSLLLTQQKMTALHSAFLAIPKQYNDTVTHLMAEQNKLFDEGVAIPSYLQKSIDEFHQEQADTLKQHEKFLALQAQASSQLFDSFMQEHAESSDKMFQENMPQAKAIKDNPFKSESVKKEEINCGEFKRESVSEKVINDNALKDRVLKEGALKECTAHESQPVMGQIPHEMETMMLDVVAEKTGYPTDMLSLDMDMEADLGIDSIKRVEILGTVQDKAASLPPLN